MPPQIRVQFPLSSTPFPGSNIGRRAINFGDMLKCHCAGCYHAQRIPILRPQSHWTGGLNIFEPTETSWVVIIVPQSEDEGYVPGALEKEPWPRQTERFSSRIRMPSACEFRIVSVPRRQLLNRAKKILFDCDFAFCHLPFSNYTLRYGSGIRP